MHFCDICRVLSLRKGPCALETVPPDVGDLKAAPPCHFRRSTAPPSYENYAHPSHQSKERKKKNL